EIRPVALGDVERLRAHLDARRRHRERPQLIALGLLQILEDRDRLAAGRVVVEYIGELLALEAAAQFLLDELDRCGALRPVGRRHRKQVGIASAIRRRRDAEAGRGPWYLV